MGLKLGESPTHSLQDNLRFAYRPSVEQIYGRLTSNKNIFSHFLGVPQKGPRNSVKIYRNFDLKNAL